MAQIATDLTEMELRALAEAAVRRGYKMKSPEPGWTDRDRRDAAHWLIERFIRNIIENNHKPLHGG